MKTVKDYLKKRLAEKPESVACSYLCGSGYMDMTWRELMGQVYALGSCLIHEKARGNIFILGENSVHWLLVHITAVCGAGIAVGLDQEQSPQELIQQIKFAGGGTLFYSDAYTAKAQEIASDMKGLHLVCMDGAAFEDMLAKGRELIKSGVTEYMDNHPVSDEITALVPTSGTTAGEKFVTYTQRNIIAASLSLVKGIEMQASDRSAAILPLHHMYGLYVACYAHLISGGTPCILSGFKRCFETMRIFKTNRLYITPALAEAMLSELKATGLNGIAAAEKLFGFAPDYIAVGGAPTEDNLTKAIAAYGIAIAPGYGATETFVVSANPPDAIQSQTVGRVFDHYDVTIADDGEILVRSEAVTQGYLHHPVATANAIQGGWFHTGDIGSLDADGYLTIKGRKKNMILLKNGKNLFAEELEEKLSTLESIVEVRVFQRDDEIVAEIYSTQTQAQVESEISELNRKLASYERIHRIKMRKTPLERTALHKIVRR